MKKFISLTLALTSVLMSVSAVNAAEVEKIANKASYSDVQTTDKYFNAVELLTKLDIMEGYEDNTFQPDKKVTRAEFAKLIVDTLGKAMQMQAEAATGQDTIFTDVTSDHWAAGYITTAVSSGIINGMGDGTFAPEANVTYYQAMKMLACAAGYEQWSMDRGNWPLGYEYWAKQIDVNKGLEDISTEAELTRAQVAVMLNNTLNTPVCVNTGKATIDFYGNRYPELKAKDGTGVDFQSILTKRHNIYAVKGFLDKDDVFVITSARNFNDEKYDEDSEEKIDVHTSYGADSLNIDTDAYIQIDENDEYNLIYMY